MSRLLVKRMRLFLLLGFVALIIGGIAWWQLRDQRRIITAQVDHLNTDAQIQESGLIFGDFSTQGIDDYLASLKHKLTALDERDQAFSLQLDHADLFPGLDVVKIAEQRATLRAETSRYLLDSGYMGFSSYDYLFLGLHADTRQVLGNTLQLFASIAFNLQQTLQDPLNHHPDQMYVRKGQIIGLQGCTGVCDGTHVHFVVADNAVAKDPCDYLPKRELSRWGMVPDCGVSGATQISWPMYLPWILTDTFDDISPVTHEHHGAIDIIDRVYAPVLAAQNGWYSSRLRDCTYGVICNDGAAKIVTVCGETDCDKGIHTDYWHLAWMADESPAVELKPD